VDFKTSPQEAVVSALGDLNVDEDDLSDEYDFMDEDEDAQQRRAREKARKRQPQHKYREMLQQLADRKADELVIDLDDLATVSRPGSRISVHTDKSKKKVRATGG
jgi:DNA replication licensing factor MCM7